MYHGVDGIIPELNTHRRIQLYREHIQDIAPDGKLSLSGNALPTDIAAGREPADEFTQICRAVPAQQNRGVVQLFR